MGEILGKIKDPKQVQQLSLKEKEILCCELRKEIILATSKNGGHLASNLGVVELTVALFSVFNLPSDSIIWDVGHQCYSHKMLTGRYEQFNTIRIQNGLTGFPDRSESDCDVFTTGHSSASLSSAFGLQVAKQLKNENAYTVAVIGDGALSGGLAFEGLNNIGRSKKNFIIILNDNKMSISKNVGSVSRHLNHLRADSGYLKLKNRIEIRLSKIPKVGKYIANGIKKLKYVAKRTMLNSTLFEYMGIEYYGPYDGHDIEELSNVLNTVKKLNKPVLIHVKTVKGKGYEPAQNKPKNYHGVSSFDILTGKILPSKKSFSTVFGNALNNAAEVNENICAITAAMSEGTGLTSFAENHRERFFDVGIAEAHAVTFAAGLSAKGMLPVFAVYSTFLQRSYDSIVHDVALQDLKMILAVDRAGFVGEDGKTHQGLLDVSMLKNLPNTTIFSPTYFDELDFTLQKAIEGDYKLTAIRYPRGHEGEKPEDFVSSREDFDVYGKKNAENCIICYGRVFCEAAKLAKKNNLKIVKLNKIYPIEKEVVKIASKCKNILFLEEAVCGVVENYASEIYIANSKANFKKIVVKNPFANHASMQEQLKECKLDKDGIQEMINKHFKR